MKTTPCSPFQNSEMTRRRFLETTCAALGVVLLAGCASEGGSGENPSGELTATALPEGGFSLAHTNLPASGQALAFKFPDGKPGLAFTNKAGVSGAVNAECTHMQCTVEWTGGNDPREAFSCPCHASKFRANGEVTGGAAKKPLTAYSLVAQGTDLVLKPV